jgi:hypothetical protein
MNPEIKKQAEIEIQVGALALHGFNAFDADGFSAALSGELTRLLAAETPRPGAWYVPAARIELGAGSADSASAGVALARAIYAGMQGGQR